MRKYMTRETPEVGNPSIAGINVCGVSTFDSSSNSLGSVDHNFEIDRIKRFKGEENTRDFTYFLLGGARLAYLSIARLTLIKLVANMSASADVLALATAEFDVGHIPIGSTVTYKWRGKPVFARHRSSDEVEAAAATDLSVLPDPQSDADRVQTSEWLIVVGICTHLGCVPIPNAGDYGGWFCPCHGSHYDTSGRIRKGPAPQNLEIPPYKLTGTKLVLG